jgi:hypothetical protein
LFPIPRLRATSRFRVDRSPLRDCASEQPQISPLLPLRIPGENPADGGGAVHTGARRRVDCRNRHPHCCCEDGLRRARCGFGEGVESLLPGSVRLAQFHAASLGVTTPMCCGLAHLAPAEEAVSRAGQLTRQSIHPPNRPRGPGDLFRRLSTVHLGYRSASHTRNCVVRVVDAL